MDQGSAEGINTELAGVMHSSALSALLPPCPEWPDLN